MKGEQAVEKEVRFRIFRGAEAPSLEQSGMEKHWPGEVGPPGNVIEALSSFSDHGYSHRMLFAGQGMSLLHLWFKSGFVLPRHSHDTDCLYFVIAGTLRIGTTDLEAGDGFFVGADVPYAYAAGEQGVEVLEFRTAEAFYIDLLVGNPSFWTKFVGTMKTRQPDWSEEPRPSSGSLIGNDG